jgi:CRP-like cAMP-binding protein
MAVQEMSELLLFEDLSPKQLKSMTGFVQEIAYQPGDILFEQGTDALYFCILLSGEVEIRYKPDDEPAISIAHVHHGGVFGWSAILGHATFTSTAVCTTPAIAYRLSCRDLRALCKQNPEMGKRFLEHLAAAIPERLRKTHRQFLSNLARSIGEDCDCARRVAGNG